MIVGGYAVWSAAQGLQSTINVHSSNGKIIGSLLMAGIASGFTFQTCVQPFPFCVRAH